MTTYGSNNRQEFCDTTELLKLWRFLTLAGFVGLAKNFLRERRALDSLRRKIIERLRTPQGPTAITLGQRSGFCCST
jgi:hypothetical protein